MRGLLETTYQSSGSFPLGQAMALVVQLLQLNPRALAAEGDTDPLTLATVVPKLQIIGLQLLATLLTQSVLPGPPAGAVTDAPIAAAALSCSATPRRFPASFSAR